VTEDHGSTTGICLRPRGALSPARPFARSSRRLATPPPTSGEGWWPRDGGSTTGIQLRPLGALSPARPFARSSRRLATPPPNCGGGVVAERWRLDDWHPTASAGGPPPGPTPQTRRGSEFATRMSRAGLTFIPSPACGRGCGSQAAGEGFARAVGCLSSASPHPPQFGGEAGREGAPQTQRDVCRRVVMSRARAGAGARFVLPLSEFPREYARRAHLRRRARPVIIPALHHPDGTALTAHHRGNRLSKAWRTTT
jgi:hypothetical protein